MLCFLERVYIHEVPYILLDNLEHESLKP